MEHPDRQLHLSARNDQTQQSNGQLSELKHLGKLMEQARDFFPSQEIPDGTAEVYLRVWIEIVAKYKMQRFEVALWNVLRRSQFFPLPYAIEEECLQTKIMASELPGTRMKVFECPACHHRLASLDRVTKCQECGAEVKMVYDGRGGSDVEMKRFHERQRTNPEDFVSIAEIMKDALARVAAKTVMP
jgi:hypothetical protein